MKHAASNRTLWRLNVCGLLRLADEPDEDAVITSAQGKVAIRRELDRLGISRFPSLGEQYLNPDPPEESSQ